MSERSKAWKDKKSTLQSREERLKSELEDVSTDVESKVKTVIKVSLITGGVVLAGYGLYKMLSSPSESEIEEKPARKKPEKEEVQEVKVKSGFSLKNILLERLALVAVKFIGNQLTTFLNARLSEDEEETEN